MSSDALSSQESIRPAIAPPDRSPADLSDAIGQLHALGGAVLHAMLETIRAYDGSEAWRQDGASSMAAWVSFALGVTATTGADYVRVARALAHLPQISRAFQEGRLCYEHVRALVRVATADTEAGLLEQTAGLTATQVEMMVRRLREIPADEAAEANRRRSLRLRWRIEDRTLRLSGRLPDVDGAVVASAIELLAERSVAHPDDPDREPWDARCADALVELASWSLGPQAPEAAVTGTDVHIENTSCSRADVAGTNEATRTKNSIEAADAPGQGDAEPDGVSHVCLGHEEPITAGAEALDGPGVETDAESGVASAQPRVESVAGAGGEADAEAGYGAGIGTTLDAKPRSRVSVDRAPVDAGRPLVVVHVEAGALVSGGEGAAVLEYGAPLASETARRLGCDAWVQAVVEGQGGRPVGVGRRRRTVPRSLLHVLRHRDRGCRFPGCTRTRWVHAHHVDHWADGGPTDLGNLLLMCSAHHRFVHEGGWRIEGDPEEGDLRFVDPGGRVLRVGPPGLRPEVADRFGVGVSTPQWAGPARADLAWAESARAEPATETQAWPWDP